MKYFRIIRSSVLNFAFIAGMVALPYQVAQAQMGMPAPVSEGQSIIGTAAACSALLVAAAFVGSATALALKAEASILASH